MEQSLTPPCPNGCKAAISDAVSIGLFVSTSNFFSSFSLPPPPFPTIRKYSSIFLTHHHTPPHPKRTHSAHRYSFGYPSSQTGLVQVLFRYLLFLRSGMPVGGRAGKKESLWSHLVVPTYLPPSNFSSLPHAFPFQRMHLLFPTFKWFYVHIVPPFLSSDCADSQGVPHHHTVIMS